MVEIGEADINGKERSRKEKVQRLGRMESEKRLRKKREWL